MKKEKKGLDANKFISSCDVPSWKRLIAYIVDWYLGCIFAALPMVMIYMKATDTQDLNINLFQYPRQYAILSGCLGLIFALFYYMIVPLKIWNGQTLGKRWCHYRIVKVDKDTVMFKELFLRQIIGIFLVEGALIFPSKLFHQILSIVCDVNLITPLRYIGIVVSILSSLFVIFRKDHRAIHDLISNTKVISINELPNSRK
jgi:uncharacterized RDD family membrane protein YckC